MKNKIGIYNILLIFSILLIIISGSLFGASYLGLIGGSTANPNSKIEELCKGSEICFTQQSLTRNIVWPRLYISEDLNRNLAEDVKIPKYYNTNVIFVSSNEQTLDAGIFLELSEEISNNNFEEGDNICINTDIIRILNIKSPALFWESTVREIIEAGGYSRLILTHSCNETKTDWMPVIFI